MTSPSDRHSVRMRWMDSVCAVYIAEQTHHLFEEQHLSEGAVRKRTQASGDSGPDDRRSSPKPKQAGLCVCVFVFPSSSEDLNGSLIITRIIFTSIQPSLLPSTASTAPPRAKRVSGRDAARLWDLTGASSSMASGLIACLFLDKRANDAISTLKKYLDF